MKTPKLETKTLITLVGPPNSGKTTLFNYLSGKNYKTVNYPGSTVEYSTSKIQSKFNMDADLLDSPGIISLISNSPDEQVAIDSLYNHPKFGSPQLVITTVDAAQLSRHLLLVKQLLDSGFKVIVALTMIDLLSKKGFYILTDVLADELGCDVVKIDGRTGHGTEELIKLAEDRLSSTSENKTNSTKKIEFDNNYLLKIFEIIEKIEQKVLKEKTNNFAPNIEAANKKLNIITIEDKGKNSPDNLTLKIDRILLHKVWGLLFFFLIMSLTFTSIFWAALPLMELVDIVFGYFAMWSSALIGNNWFGGLISNGVISGVGSVLVFVPQIVILFLILGFLEDTGYLARGAMLMDKPLSKIGLNGRSFVPMLSGFACAIPAMMAARTIHNRRERLITIFIIPLMSCSARLPVYALLIAYITPRNLLWLGGVGLAVIYLFSTISSLVAAGIINKLNKRIIKEEDNSSFILELPTYRIPKWSVIFNNTFTSSKIYLKKAGPVILTFSLILWLLTYFPNYNPKVDVRGMSKADAETVINVERISGSYASDLGKLIQPVMTPVGMDWRIGVSLIAAFTAREVFVSSLALIFKVTSNSGPLQASLLHAMRNATIEGTDQKLFTTASILGLIIFFMFAMQCISTIAVSRKETGSWRIPLLQVLIYTSTAYLFMFITVNGLRLFGIN